MTSAVRATAARPRRVVEPSPPSQQCLKTHWKLTDGARYTTTTPPSWSFWPSHCHDHEKLSSGELSALVVPSSCVGVSGRSESTAAPMPSITFSSFPGADSAQSITFFGGGRPFAFAWRAPACTACDAARDPISFAILSPISGL